MPILLKSELVRFGLVAVLGLVVDILIAWSLAAIAGVPLVLAAAIGFAAGAGSNYVCHEFWTFHDGARQLSVRRAALYAATLGFTLATRLIMVLILEQLLTGAGQEIITLVLATAVSFCVSYLTGKLLVFKSGANTKTTTQTKG